jgi:hypothetical protein
MAIVNAFFISTYLIVKPLVIETAKASIANPKAIRKIEKISIWKYSRY